MISRGSFDLFLSRVWNFCGGEFSRVHYCNLLLIEWRIFECILWCFSYWCEGKRKLFIEEAREVKIVWKMTVETTSFLSGAKITSTGSEKSAKFLKNHKNLIIFLLAVILLLFCVSASVLQVSTSCASTLKKRKEEKKFAKLILLAWKMISCCFNRADFSRYINHQFNFISFCI